MPYQIDFLPVGDGARSGDAIALRFGDFSDPAKQRVVVIDGGFKDSGKALVEHIRTLYGTSFVNIVVSTHPDADHSSGLMVVLEELTVGQLWMHRPWLHTEDIAKMFKDGRVTDMSVAEGIRKSLDEARCLETIATRKRIPITEPFAGVCDDTNSLFVIGPSREFYERLLLKFRCTPAPKTLSLYEALLLGTKSVVLKVAEALNIETIGEPEGTHAENDSSAILVLAIGNECVLFTADAGLPALQLAAEYLEAANFDFSRIKLVQVPHHGSKHNVGPSILNRLLGPVQPTDVQVRQAIVSASRDGAPKYPSKQVLNAFRRRGAHVWGTMNNGTVMFNSGALRPGWSGVEKVPFYDEVED